MKELEQYFKAMSGREQVRILNLLLHGELCVCDIQYVLETSQPNVSRHLAVPEELGAGTRSAATVSESSIGLLSRSRARRRSSSSFSPGCLKARSLRRRHSPIKRGYSEGLAP